MIVRILEHKRIVLDIVHVSSMSRDVGIETVLLYEIASYYSFMNSGMDQRWFLVMLRNLCPNTNLDQNTKWIIYVISKVPKSSKTFYST